MRTHIVSAAASGDVNGAVQSMLLNHIPDQSRSPDDCDVILVPISQASDYQFNPALLDIKKPWVLLDFLEIAWDYFDDGSPTLLFGYNANKEKRLSAEWHKFDKFCSDCPPVVYFKRELLAKDVSARVKPIDWPCTLEIPPLQTEPEFNARSIEAMHCWGYSSPSRPRLHAAIFEAMATHNIGVISELDHVGGYFQNPSPRTWASIYSPYYARKNISKIMELQAQSKISVSLPGCGRKSFRMAESPVASTMALQFDDLAYSYPWKHLDNCIKLRPDHEFEDLEVATKRDDLYPIFCASQETIEKYRGRAYVRGYVMPLIAAAL